MQDDRSQCLTVMIYDKLVNTQTHRDRHAILLAQPAELQNRTAEKCEKNSVLRAAENAAEIRRASLRLCWPGGLEVFRHLFNNCLTPNVLNVTSKLFFSSGVTAPLSSFYLFLCSMFFL